MRIFVTRKLPGESLKPLLESGHEVAISDFDRPLTAEELLEKANGVDALLSLLTDKINGEVVDAIGPQLKIVSNYAVGFDNINVPELSERGIIVTNTPNDAVNEAVAELSWSMVLALARKLVESDEAVKRGAYSGWEPAIFLGHNIAGKTLGIVGMGRIGSMVARMAKGFDVRVLYYKRSRDEEAERETGAEYADMDRLLSESDFVSLHVPLTAETRHMINRESLSKMKKGALLVNTARGPVVDEHDLVDSLRDGHLGGAALDVFDNEPNINPELVNMENVILTPHIASATWEARDEMGRLAVEAILQTLRGEKPSTIVNLEVWDHARAS